jgi:hypothetical protein
MVGLIVLVWIMLMMAHVGACAAEANVPARNTSSDALDVVIVAGQSNAQGWTGDGRRFEPDPIDAEIPFRWMIPGHNPRLRGESQKSKGWETLGPQNGICGYGNPASHFGLEISMARALAKAGTHIAVIKVSIGATSLYGDWKLPGEKGLTDAMLAEVQEAMNDLGKAGRKPRIRGFVWIQGESDANAEHAKDFQPLLSKLISELRKAWNEPNLPVVLGLDEQHPYVRNYPQVVAAQKAIAEADPFATWTSMVGFEKHDVSHLTNAGLHKHGERIADALTALWNARKTTGKSPRLNGRKKP